MKRAITAALLAAVLLLGASPGGLAVPSALAGEPWVHVLRPVEITTASGASVMIPLVVYVKGTDNGNAVRSAPVTAVARASLRGGTDVEVTLGAASGDGDRPFFLLAAINFRDPATGAFVFSQRGGSSSRPLNLAVHFSY